MQRVAVGFGIDGDRLNPHAAGGLDDATGDLAAICDQNSFEHALVCLATLGGAIWHGGREVTIPSYSKTRPRQRYMSTLRGLAPRLPNIFSRNTSEIFRVRR